MCGINVKKICHCSVSFCWLRKDKLRSLCQKMLNETISYSTNKDPRICMSKVILSATIYFTYSIHPSIFYCKCCSKLVSLCWHAHHILKMILYLILLVFTFLRYQKVIHITVLLQERWPYIEQTALFWKRYRYIFSNLILMFLSFVYPYKYCWLVILMIWSCIFLNKAFQFTNCIIYAWN